MVVVLVGLVSALVKKVTDLVKYAKAGDWSSVVTQGIAWAVGIGSAFLLAAQNITEHITIQGASLAHANGAALTLLGLAIGSGGSVLQDILKAIDNTQSAEVPKL